MRWFRRLAMVLVAVGLLISWPAPASADGGCYTEPRDGEMTVRGRIVDSWTATVTGYDDETRIVRLQIDEADTPGVPGTIEVLWDGSVSPWWRFERTVWRYDEGLWQGSNLLCPNGEPTYSVATPAIPATLHAAIFVSTWQDALILGLPTVVLLGLAAASLRRRRQRHAHQRIIASRRTPDAPDGQVRIDA